MNVNELNDQPTVCAYLDCSLRATISCLPLQHCQGNGSHPASPDPGTGPGLLPLLLAPAVGDTRALGAAGLLLVLLQECVSPWTSGTPRLAWQCLEILGAL